MKKLSTCSTLKVGGKCHPNIFEIIDVIQKQPRSQALPLLREQSLGMRQIRKEQAIIEMKLDWFEAGAMQPS